MKYLASILVIINTLLSIDKLMAQPPSTPEFKQEFLDIINRIRAKGCTCGTKRMAPTGALVWNDQLAIAAMGHAKDMANQNYFSHTSKDGRSMNDRISAAGYTFSGYRSYMIGENIAQGQMSIQEVMNGWFKSPGHCMNLMNPNFKEIGIAEYNTYWVQDFGGREPFSAEQQKLIRSGKMKVIERN